MARVWRSGTTRGARAIWPAFANETCYVGRLDDIAEDLTVEGRNGQPEGNVVIYDFTVRAGVRDLLKAGPRWSWMPACLRPNMKRALVTGGSGAIGAAVCQTWQPTATMF